MHICVADRRHRAASVFACVCVTSARNTSCNSAECEHVKHRLCPRVRACVTFVGGARMSSHFSTRLLPSRQERFRFVSNFLTSLVFFLSFFFLFLLGLSSLRLTVFVFPPVRNDFSNRRKRSFSRGRIDYRPLGARKNI